MLTMYRYMNRQKAGGELEPIVRFSKLDFPETGPADATDAQRRELAEAVADAATKEARLGQIVLATWSSNRGIVALEDVTKRGQPDALVWLVN